MHHDFWHQAWTSGRIGFHQEQVHDGLQQVWPTLHLPAGATVLVPLCGKSLDMAWLVQQGMQVVGVELSELACAAFFQSQGWTPEVRQQGAFRAWEAPGITLLQGDVFDLPDDLTVDAIYDRAATIALPEDLRTPYADLLTRRLRPGAPMVLSTLDYPQEERNGPPFSVPMTEVERLYGPGFEVSLHSASDDADTAAQRQAWGLSHLSSKLWTLRRR